MPNLTNKGQKAQKAQKAQKKPKKALKRAKWARNFIFIGITVVIVIINWKKEETIGPNLTKKGKKLSL